MQIIDGFRSDLDHHAVVEIYWICAIYRLATYIIYCFVTKAIILTYLRHAIRSASVYYREANIVLHQNNISESKNIVSCDNQYRDLSLRDIKEM